MKFPDIFAFSYLAKVQAEAEEEALQQMREGKVPSEDLTRRIRCCVKEHDIPADMPNSSEYISDGALRNYIVRQVQHDYEDVLNKLPDVLINSINWDNVINLENMKYQAITLFDTCERKYWVKKYDF